MTSLTNCRVERLATQEHLDTLEREWKDLMAEIPGAPLFLTWEWIRTWWTFFGSGRELWLLTARDDQERLLGIAPLMSEEQRIGLVSLRRIAFIGTGAVFPVHLDFLAVEPFQKVVSKAFLRFLQDQSSQWDILSLAYLACDSVLTRPLEKQLGSACKGAQVTSPYLLLPGNWETLQGTLSKKLRRNLRYFRTRLEDEHPGAVSFSSLENLDKVPGAVKKLEEFSRHRLHAQGLTSAFDEESFLAFHQAMACLAFERGWLRLYQLAVHDEVIALFYCFRFHDRLYAYQTGFNMDWSLYSPGRILMAYGIQSAILEGIHELDWLAGDEEYKHAWTNQVRTEFEILFSCNPRGRLWMQSRCLEEQLRLKVKQILPMPFQHRINRLFSHHHATVQQPGDEGS